MIRVTIINIPFVEPNHGSGTDSYSPDKPDFDHLSQSKNISEYQYGCLRRIDKFNCTLDPNKFQFMAHIFCKNQCYQLWNEIGDSMLNTLP